jgi:hypothetical protein
MRISGDNKEKALLPPSAYYGSYQIPDLKLVEGINKVLKSIKNDISGKLYPEIKHNDT